MRKYFFILMFCFISFGCLYAQSFEGHFTMHIMDESSISRLLFTVKKDQIIIQPLDETLPRPMKILMKKNSNDIYILTEEQGVKAALKTTFHPLAVSSSGKSDDKVVFTNTGAKKVINGYTCHEFFVTDTTGEKFQIWFTADFGFTIAQLFDYMGKFSAALSGGDYNDVTKYNGYDAYKNNMAMEINEIKEGKIGVQIMIKDIVKKSVEDNQDFELKDRTIIDLDKMKKAGE